MGANGMVPGEGVGVVVLKRLSRRSPIGTDPCSHSREQHQSRRQDQWIYGSQSGGAAGLIQEAIARAGVHPREISYVEAHGTGPSWAIRLRLRG